MSDLSNYSFTGRITKDAKFNTLASGKSLLDVSVAVNTGYKDNAKTTFISVKKWGESGKNLVPYLTKGTLVAGSGQLSLSEWTDREGKSRTTVEVMVSDLQLLAAPNKQDRPAPVLDEAEF